MSLMYGHRQLVPKERGGLCKGHAFLVRSLRDERVGQLLTVGAQVAKAVEGDGDEGVLNRFRSALEGMVLLDFTYERSRAELLGFLRAIGGQELVLEGEVDEGAPGSEAGDALFASLSPSLLSRL